MQTVSEDGSDRDRVQSLRINAKIDLEKKRLTSVDLVSDRDLAALSCDRQRDRGL